MSYSFHLPHGSLWIISVYINRLLVQTTWHKIQSGNTVHSGQKTCKRFLYFLHLNEFRWIVHSLPYCNTLRHKSCISILILFRFVLQYVAVPKIFPIPSLQCIFIMHYDCRVHEPSHSLLVISVGTTLLVWYVRHIVDTWYCNFFLN